MFFVLNNLDYSLLNAYPVGGWNLVRGTGVNK